VNLFAALDRMRRVLRGNKKGDLIAALLSEARQVHQDEIDASLAISRLGASLIPEGSTVLTHCNAGMIATAAAGTALGAIVEAHRQGKVVRAIATETRPLLQGARLTAWELKQMGIPFDIISDNAAGYFLRTGQAQKVFFGADRVAANGDVANKIGSYMLALAAHDNQVPVYSVFPCSTVDLQISDGKQIPIEERDQEEVLALSLMGKRVVPEGATARNPAFDVTPARLITAYITELGVVQQPFVENYKKLLQLKKK